LPHVPWHPDLAASPASASALSVHAPETLLGHGAAAAVAAELPHPFHAGAAPLPVRVWACVCVCVCVCARPCVCVRMWTCDAIGRVCMCVFRVRKAIIGAHRIVVNTNVTYVVAVPAHRGETQGKQASNGVHLQHGLFICERLLGSTRVH